MAATTAAAVPAVAAGGGVGGAPPASLYVGDLDPDLTEAQLFEVFGRIGPVTSIRVCRDAVSRRSLGYAYVNYNAAVDETAAARALEALNYTVLNGRPIRIMWSHRDPSTRKSGLGNIFIKNLDESIDNKALHDTFIAFGNILSCKVAMLEGKSKGYGFVHFETDEAANLAIEKVNGMLLEGRKVYVGKFLKKSERLAPGAETKFTNLYIKNLDQEVTEETLLSEFSTFGKITNLVVMKDENERSKGFGFVNFESPEDAKKAVDEMNGFQIGSKVIYVGRAQKKAEREQILRRQFEEKRLERIQKYQGVNLYVKNLDDIIDDDYLRNEFSAYGTITSAKVMRDEKGVSRGFGFVCFSTSEEALRAVNEANNRMVHGKPMYVALAQRKEVRRAQLEQHYAQRMAGLIAPPGAAVAAAYPPVYFTTPGILPPAVTPRPGIMYQPVVRPGGWRAGSMPPPGRPAIQPLPPYTMVSTAQRPQRPVRTRGTVPVQPQAGQTVGQLPPMQQQLISQQQTQQPAPYKDAARTQQQRPRQTVKYASNGRPRDAVSPAVTPQPSLPAGLPSGIPAIVSQVPSAVTGADMLSSMLAAASPQEQKQMLGERLFPLVQQHQYDLAGKITGMLLEMDNSELLLLLESPDALMAKVDEAVHVLQQHQHVKTVPDVPANALPVNGEVAVV